MKNKRSLIIAIVTLVAGYFGIQNPDALTSLFMEPNRQILVEEPVATNTDFMPSMPVIISDSRVRHILHGDGKGGGHLYGTGAPCKSEFPQSWDAGKVIDVTRKIAANDNLPWKRQNNGYYVTEAFEGDVKVRVVKGPQKQRVITAYPTNVKRNPCPANDF